MNPDASTTPRTSTKSKTRITPETGDVFRDERTGRIVDVSSGAREMLRSDAAWANVAYRVSRELSDEDRQMLTVLAMEYLKKRQGNHT